MVARTLHYRNLKGSPRVESLLAVALTVAMFGPAYGLFRFHDDWTFVDRATRAVSEGRTLSFILSPLHQHWSPLWHFVEVTNVYAVGWEGDGFIRTLIAISVVIAALALARLLGAAGLGGIAIWVAMAALVAHPAGAAARFSFDTYSQCLADLIVWISGAWVAERLMSGRRLESAQVARLALTLGVGLLMKEQALSGFAIVSLMLIVTAARRPDVVTWRETARAIAVLSAVAVTFAVIRRGLGVQLAAEGPFSLCPACAPQNAMTLLGMVVLPVPTLTVLDAWRAQPVETVRLALIAVATALLLVMAAIGVALHQHPGTQAPRHPGTQAPRHPGTPGTPGARLALLALCGLAGSWFPVVLLEHVGELYAHSMLFWWAALVALAVDGWRRSTAPALVHVAGVAYVAALALGAQANLAEMRATGERARNWLRQIASVTSPVPDGDWIVVTAEGDYKDRGDYGLYRLTTPQVLVMTGLSPAAIRYAVGDRLQVVIDQARDEPAWAARIAAAEAAGRLHVVRLSGGRAGLEPR